MAKQREIEIYVAGCSLADALDWAASRVGTLGVAEPAGAVTVYQSPWGLLIVTPQIEDGRFVSLWFNMPESPWPTDVDCARDAARALKCTVRCDPGEHYPEVPTWSPVFLEVVCDGERLIEWEPQG